MDNITLTDYPRPKTIEAHYRGLETARLLHLRKQLANTMMVWISESAGGYNIMYDYKQIEEELNFRNVFSEN